MFGKLWTKLVGLTGWNHEVALLRNTTDDDTPPPGNLPERPTAAASQPAPGWVDVSEGEPAGESQAH